MLINQHKYKLILSQKKPEIELIPPNSEVCGLLEDHSEGRYAKRPCKAPASHLLKDLVTHLSQNLVVTP
jgi:hypothetical protein